MSWPGRGWITQLLYALKLRTTIIGYVPPLVVYGSFEPLPGDTYLLHLGAHISSPWFACILVVECASWPFGSWLLEYIYALLILGPFIFGMPGILSPVLGPSTDPGVILGGIKNPYYAHIFGSGHIPLLHLWKMLTPFSRSLHRWSPSQGW